MRNLLCLASATLLCTTAISCGEVPVESSSDLELSLDKTLLLPNGYMPIGSDVSGMGDILLWSSSGRLISVAGEDFVITHDVRISQGNLIGARLKNSDGWVEFVDAKSQLFITIDSSGAVAKKHSFSIPFAGQQAVYRGGSWFISGRLQDSSFGVYKVERSTSPVSTRIMDLGVGSSHPLWLSGTSEAVAVSSASDPSNDTFVFGEVERKLRVSSSRELLDELSADPNALWRSLMPIDIDVGYLQVIADQRSDRRIIVRFDADGNAIKYSKIDAPLGFIGSVPRSTTLFGTRAGTVVSVVRYKWRWLKGPIVPISEKTE